MTASWNRMSISFIQKPFRSINRLSVYRPLVTELLPPGPFFILFEVDDIITAGDGMCFLALVYKRVPDYPVVVAANRDELADRPSLPPRPVRPGIWAGVDRVAGGTWLGVNDRGLVVGVANLRTPDPPDPGARSRGLLCLDLLTEESAIAIPGRLNREIKEAAYNGFNVLAADGASAGVAMYQGRSLDWRPLAPGVHVIGNSLPDDPDDPKVRRGRSLIRVCDSVDETIRMLQDVCRDHGLGSDGADAICVHRERGVTRSSTILALHDADPARHVYLFAEGHPCTGKYRDVSALLRPPAGPEVKEGGHDGQQ
jgi:hypothetical protein